MKQDRIYLLKDTDGNAKGYFKSYKQIKSWLDENSFLIINRLGSVTAARVDIIRAFRAYDRIRVCKLESAVTASTRGYLEKVELIDKTVV